MAEGREDVIDYEFLRGRQNEKVVKVLSVASAAASEIFRFKCPYKMGDNGSSGNGLNFADGHIEYKELHTLITEAGAGFAHLYAYVVSKCTFLAGLTGRPIHNLEDLDCPHPPLSITTAGVHCHVTSFPDSVAQPKPRTLSMIG